MENNFDGSSCHYHSYDSYEPDDWEEAKKHACSAEDDKFDGNNYHGDREEGKPHGHGKIFRPDGSIGYEGEWKEGKLDGHGKTFISKSLIDYEGEWEEGKLHGHGKHSGYTDHFYYEGEWKEGYEDGHGKMFRPDGSIAYEGEWEQGRQQWNIEEDLINAGLVAFSIVMPDISTHFLKLLMGTIIDAKTRFYMPKTRNIEIQTNPLQIINFGTQTSALQISNIETQTNLLQIPCPGAAPECCICIDALFSGNIKVVALKCGHMLHEDCWKNIAGNICPICRKISRKITKLFT